jgi:hypothetical protein
MRQTVLDYINTENLGSFTVSTELPFSGSNQPLYLKNFKKIYVDNPQVTLEPVIPLMNGHAIETQTTTVRVYFTADAKQLPANYQTVINHIKGARDVSITGNVVRRDCLVSTEFVADSMVTQLDLIYIQIL